MVVEHSAARPTRRRRAARGSGEQLRAEIIEVTKELLASTGNIEDVSIRAVAERVGVTSPSIYLHFADKETLVNAAVANVFVNLDRAMVARVSSVDTPIERVLAAGMAYVRFAVEHPEHYRIALMSPHGRSDDIEHILTAGAFANFNALVVECAQAGVFAVDDPLAVSIGLWTAAHGVASLVIAKPHLPWGDVDAFAYRTLCAAGIGQGMFDRLDSGAPQALNDWVESVRGHPDQ